MLQSITFNNDKILKIRIAMLSKVIKLLGLFALSTTVAFGANGARFNAIEGDVGHKYEEMVMGDPLTEISFGVSDPHEKIHNAYAEKYGNPEDPNYDKDGWEVTLDNLGFFSITNDEALRPLLIKAPEVGGFSPFNLHIYKKKSESKTYIGHVDPATMMDIVGVKDEGVRKDFIAMFEPLDQWVDENFGGEVQTVAFDKLPAKPMMTFEYEFERPEDITEFTGDFQGQFEELFEKHKYIIAGFKNFKETYTDDLELPFEEYDAYWVYSLCHFTYSYNIFNKGRPDTGIFAPCSMYMYVKKDSNKLVIGMPRLSVWVAVGGIKDPKKLEWVKKLDEEIVRLMKELGATEI